MSKIISESKNIPILKEAYNGIKKLKGELNSLLHGQIAIVGMDCRFPGGANDPEQFWELLEKSSEVVSEIPKDRWDYNKYFKDLSYSVKGGFLNNFDIKNFDNNFFRISPKEAQRLDPQQRLLLEVTYGAFENASIATEKLRGEAVGVFLGISTDDYKKATLWSNYLDDIDAYSATGSMFSTAAGHMRQFSIIIYYTIKYKM